MRKRWTLSVIAPIFALIALASVPVSGKKLCKARVDCPLQFRAGDTAYVPDSVVMLSEIFEHCSPDSFDERPGDSTEDTISVFFIIDHSASMSTMDSNGTRYRLVEKIIDSLRVRSPASEVGIAIFSNLLLHNYKDDPYFVPLDTSNGWPDSYVPLTRLDQTVGGVSAVQKLKWSIALAASPNDTDIGGNRRLVNANYGMTGRHSGWDNMGNPLIGYGGTTDISLGFEAAKKAFLTARYPKNRQFIIFLSDGVHQYVDVERRNAQLDYQQGQGVPTTFTAFFINETQPIPQQILQMTENIRNSNYSTRNPTSDVWKTQGADDDLVSRLLTEQIFAGGGNFEPTPLFLVINGERATRFDGENAVFDEPFILQGPVTRFDITLAFFYPKLNFYDTLSGHYFVKLTNTPPPLKPFFPGIDCWDQGTLELRYNNESITKVEANWKDLTVRFYPSTQFPIESANLEIRNATGSDQLLKTTTSFGTYFGTPFKRDYGTAAIDDILQNGMNDSIIVIYRNPEIPLDVVRLAVKVLPPRDLEVSKAYYLDQNGGIANGYPDVIRVEFGDVLYPEELDIVRTYITLQSGRNLTIKSVQPSENGFDILLNEPTSIAPFTGLLPNERLFIENVPDLPRGGWFPKADMAIGDSMAPVIVTADYLDLSEPTLRDTLRVRFSERIKRISASEPFRFIGSSTEYSLRLSLVSSDSNYAVFTVDPLVGQTTPRQGDSIWISTSGNVLDTANVKQDGPNIKRAINYLQIYKVISAKYIDSDGDGLIDLVQVTMDRPPDQAMIDALPATTVLPAYRNFQYDDDDFVITANGFDIRVTQPAGTAPFTGVDNRDTLRIARTESSTAGLIEKTAVGIADAIPPVIKAATLKPGTVESGSEVRKDTLTVTFSEDIVPPTDPTPFVFTDGTNTFTAYVHAVTTGPRATHTFIVDSLVGRDFFAPGDSVHIDPTAGVTDQKQNVQNNENRNTPLKVGNYEYDFTVKAGPMPFNPASPGMIPPSTGIPQVPGLAVVVEPVGRVASHIQLGGTLSVFDCLGNLMVKDVDGTVVGANEKVVFVWRGTNLSNRYVGSGSYLGVAKIEDKTGHTFEEIKKFKIAVKR